MKAKARLGIWLGGAVPFGYKLNFSKLMIDENQAIIVKEMFSLFSNGVSVTTISRLISDKYGLNYGDKGNWRAQKIYNILTNPLYNGFYTWGKTSQKDGTSVRKPKGEWTKAEEKIQELEIIDDILWKAVQQRYRSNMSNKTKESTPN